MPFPPHADLFSAPVPQLRCVPLCRETAEGQGEGRGKRPLIQAPPSPQPPPVPSRRPLAAAQDEVAGEGNAGERRRLATLRQTAARLERGSSGTAPSFLSLGLPALHRHLPGEGLPCGALHEVMAAAHGDRAAAFGFLVALMAVASGPRRGSAVLVLPRGIADLGLPYGHGLAQMGLDPSRLLLVAARRPRDAFWAMEEALRAAAGLAVVAGAVEAQPDLTMSRRLNLAADDAGTPLLLLRPPAATGITAALTRWRIAAAPAARDRFGSVAGYRWAVMLERCRNGRPGQWRLEWDHVAHRFHLAEGVADRALPESADRPSLRRAV